MQVESVVGKANAALNKVCILIKGRLGIPINIGIDLYKALVRPHLEYAMPAWAMLSEQQVTKLEKVQSKSLKRVMGVFENTSINATEVIANVVPLRLRIIELCKKEWVRINSLPVEHILKEFITEGYHYDGRKGTPLGYLNFVSKDLSDKLSENGLKMKQQVRLSQDIVTQQIEVKEKTIFSSSLGNSKNRTIDQIEQAKSEYKIFFDNLTSNTLLSFTDGSVAGESCFGDGGCGVVMIKKNEESTVVKKRKVGRMVENVTCEIEGVLMALNMMLDFCKENREIRECYILTDCKSAVDVIVKQSDFRKRYVVLQKVWKHVNELKRMEVDISLIWIPGHADIEYNEMADELAKQGSKMEEDRHQEEVSEGVINRWIKEKTNITWSRMWERSEGTY